MKKLNCTEIFVAVNTAFIGFQGAVHGIAEASKGNITTGGPMMAAEGAFTLIQNYLYTGTISAVIGAAILCLGLFFLRGRHFTVIFTILCLALFATGGGVAFVLFFLFTLFAAPQMRSPYRWVQRIVSGKAGEALAKAWNPLIISSYACIISGVMIWLLILPPGAERRITGMHYLCWSLLLAGIAAMGPAVFAGLARDHATARPR